MTKIQMTKTYSLPRLFQLGTGIMEWWSAKWMEKQKYIEQDKLIFHSIMD
jgi:hypothetical protein